MGSLLGALTGALIGQETETGFMRGAVVGAISGAVFSIDVLESSLLLWQSDESGIACLLYLVKPLLLLLDLLLYINILIFSFSQPIFIVLHPYRLTSLLAF